MNKEVKTLLHKGTAIPAFPLALNEDKSFDELSQRTLVHYYIDSGVGGLAVGVHTTQFEIREHDLYEKVLQVAVEEINKRNLDRPFIKIAGVCGDTDQAVKEAQTAKKLGYDIVLLSNGNLSHYSEDELIERSKAVAEIMPIFGFYLQPSAGGRILSYEFWEKFVEIENVEAIKIAPFNRYYSLDVIKAILRSDRYEEIALYTGNDDNIIIDLLNTFKLNVNGECRTIKFVGGLLGHWAVWTKNSVEIFNKTKSVKTLEEMQKLLVMANEVTDSNAALFDVHNNFKGCIAGINEILARQGLLKGNWCLEDKEVLSEGQAEYIDEVIENYPHLIDDEFIKENLNTWKDWAKK